MTLMVRQLAEVITVYRLRSYAFTNTVVWLEYMKAFRLIYSIAYLRLSEEFGLRLHQSPTGNDIRSLAGAFKQ